jgi:hypothetical protein
VEAIDNRPPALFPDIDGKRIAGPVQLTPVQAVQYVDDRAIVGEALPQGELQRFIL